MDVVKKQVEETEKKKSFLFWFAYTVLKKKQYEILMHINCHSFDAYSLPGRWKQYEYEILKHIQHPFLLICVIYI